MSSCCELLLTRSLNARRGAAANGTTSTPSTVTCRSGMRRSLINRRTLFQVGKKLIDVAPDFRAAGKSSPFGANQSNQFVAFVDGREKILPTLRPASHRDPVDQKRDHVRFHTAQYWIGPDDVVPGRQRQRGFNGSRGTRIQAD